MKRRMTREKRAKRERERERERKRERERERERESERERRICSPFGRNRKGAIGCAKHLHVFSIRLRDPPLSISSVHHHRPLYRYAKVAFFLFSFLSLSLSLALFPARRCCRPLAALTSSEAKAGRPSGSFCEVLFFRNAGPTIVFPRRATPPTPLPVSFLQSGRVMLLRTASFSAFDSVLPPRHARLESVLHREFTGETQARAASRGSIRV